VLPPPPPGRAPIGVIAALSTGEIVAAAIEPAAAATIGSLTSNPCAIPAPANWASSSNTFDGEAIPKAARAAANAALIAA